MGLGPWESMCIYLHLYKISYIWGGGAAGLLVREPSVLRAKAKQEFNKISALFSLLAVILLLLMEHIGPGL